MSMRSGIPIFFAAVLLISSMSVVFGPGAYFEVAGKDNVVPSNYHNATVHFNVTLGSGTPASGYRVRVANSMSVSNFHEGITNSAGKLDLPLNFAILGICEIKVLDSGLRSLYYEKTDIWPDEELYKDIRLNEPLLMNHRVHGVLRNSSNDSPVPFFSIMIVGTDTNGNTFVMKNVTDTSGRYEFWAPNTSGFYRFYPETTTIYRRFSFEVYPEPGVYDHPMDIYAVPKYSSDNPVHIRIVEKDSGDFFNDGIAYIEGRPEAYDSFSIYESLYSYDDSNGWFNTTLGAGEYSITFSSDTYLGLPNLNLQDYFYVNDTPLFHEIEVDLPDYVDLEVEVWNQSGPVPDAQVSWYSYEGSVSIGCYTYTDTSGIAKLKAPTDREIDLEVYHSDHEDLDHSFDPSGMTAPIQLNLTLKELPSYADKTADLTVHVMDPVTGAAIPYSSVFITLKGDDGSYSYYETANATGVLKRTLQLTNRYSEFRSADISVENNLGQGTVRGIMLTSGMEKDVIVYVSRYELESPYVRSYFYLKDPGGTPLPGVNLQVSMEGSSDWTYTTVISDVEGKVTIVGPPGEYMVYPTTSSRHPRAHWAFNTKYFDVGTGGPLGDVTAYPIDPLDIYQGHVKDAYSKESLPDVDIFTASNRYIGPTRNSMMNGFDPSTVHLFSMFSGTADDGYFRTRGRDTVNLLFERDGYFNRRVKVEQGSRAVELGVIYMEPMSEFSLWVNGTLVNENDEPIEGYVNVFDRDHDDHELYYRYVNETGEFSLRLYPGNFIFEFFNDTLSDSMDITVGPEGIEGLVLKLIPTSDVWVYLKDWDYYPIPNINVSVLNSTTDELVIWELTNETGIAVFDLPPGGYYIMTGRTDLYDPFTSMEFEHDGWNEDAISITPPNRTVADITGKVLGEAGPFAEGIPEAVVTLLNNGEEVAHVMTEMNGNYLFMDVLHGANYSLLATPPDNLFPIEGIRSGYLPNGTGPINVTGAMLETNVHLPYEEHVPQGWLEILEYYPQGEGVPLDEPIIIVFSEPVNLTSVRDGFSISPGIEFNFTLGPEGRSVIMNHDPPFDANTTYHVELWGLVVSQDGWPLREYVGVEWDFTTSDQVSTWRIISVDVDVGPDKGVDFRVRGIPGMDLFVLIGDVGSYQLAESFEGMYGVVIEGANFEWDTTYNYHFTDVDNGEDRAPGFAGTFRTPFEPPEPWELASVIVEFNEDCSLSVEAEGLENISVWIVIGEAGSFELVEMEPGSYSILIGSDSFEWNTTYSYHFSDSEGGPDLASEFAGEVTSPEGPKGDDDDDDDTTTIGKFAVSTWVAICFICCGLPMILLFLIIVIGMITRRSRRRKDWEE
ncbi:MAG: Ig-like domain-containing protein [Thermoplasmatota archaeon]